MFLHGYVIISCASTALFLISIYIDLYNICPLTAFSRGDYRRVAFCTIPATITKNASKQEKNHEKEFVFGLYDWRTKKCILNERVDWMNKICGRMVLW